MCLDKKTKTTTWSQFNTMFTPSIETDSAEQTVYTEIRCNRMWHLIRVDTVYHQSRNVLGT